MFSTWLTQPWNLAVIKYIQHFSTPFLDRFFVLITTMGEDYFFIVLMGLIFWCCHREFGYRLGFAYLFNGVLNTLIKDWLMIPRPIGLPGIRSLHLVTAAGYSFPSGHAQMTTSFWSSVMLHFRRGWVYGAGIVMILLVSLSRLYLGVHRPVDLIGGIVIGLMGVIVSNLLFDYAERSHRRWLMLPLAVPLLLGVNWIQDPTYYKVAGVWAGFALGYPIESTYIVYKVEAPRLVQLFKVLFGVLVILLIKESFKGIVPVSPFFDFLRYFLIGLWVVAIAPWIFQRIFRTARST